jgi:hypothetical protein
MEKQIKKRHRNKEETIVSLRKKKERRKIEETEMEKINNLEKKTQNKQIYTRNET